VEFGKGFVKGVGDTAGGIVNSPAGQFVSGQIDPVGTQARRGINAAVTGDAGKLAPPNPFANLGDFDPNDPKQQQKAQASVQSTLDLGRALLGGGGAFALAKSAPDAADVLMNGDPTRLGKGRAKSSLSAWGSRLVESPASAKPVSPKQGPRKEGQPKQEQPTQPLPSRP
jgi:hypothetical protein